MFGYFGREGRLDGCGVWLSWCEVAVVPVVLLLRYSSRENRVWFEAEELRCLLLLLTEAKYKKVHVDMVAVSMEVSRRQGQRWGSMLSMPWSRWEQVG